MAKPKLALLPAAQGSKLYSVLPSSGVGDFDFTRSGSATRINSQGLIETVSSGVSRLNYPMIDGVVKGCPSHLLEPQRTNIIPRSENIDTGWSKANITVLNSQTISPDGTLNAGLVTVTNANAGHPIYDTLSGAVTQGVKYFMSCFVKKSTTNFILLSEGYTNSRIYVDLENGVINLIDGSATDEFIEYYGNGWYRIGFCFIPVNTSHQFALYVLNNQKETGFVGNGEAVYFWGAMTTQGEKSSYIPTNGSAVTRSAETANGSGDAATFNDSEGVLMFEGSALANDGTERYIYLGDGSNANRVVIRYSPLENDLRMLVSSGGSTQVTLGTTNYNILDNHKIALKYKQNDFSLFVDGFEALTDVSGSTPIGLNQLNFSLTPFYGNTKQLQYFDTALNSEDLEKLTSWVSFTDMAESQLYSIE